jgi:tripartite-type tricarboxylate transporter receptor subunit TctC
MLARRAFLRLGAGVVLFPAASRAALAQPYPARPVRIMVGAPPGGGFDILARLTGHWLAARLGQSFVIENRPGAGHTIATEAVVRAPADGYTLLMVGPDHMSNATLYDKLSFNFIRDIAPVASITRQTNVIAVVDERTVGAPPTGKRTRVPHCGGISCQWTRLPSPSCKRLCRREPDESP